jgi:hypothetical protein
MAGEWVCNGHYTILATIPWILHCIYIYIPSWYMLSAMAGEWVLIGHYTILATSPWILHCIYIYSQLVHAFGYGRLMGLDWALFYFSNNFLNCIAFIYIPSCYMLSAMAGEWVWIGHYTILATIPWILHCIYIYSQLVHAFGYAQRIFPVRTIGL